MQQGTVVESCHETRYNIPVETYCLKSVIHSKAYGMSLYTTIIRIIYRYKLYVITCVQDESDYKANPSEINELLKGLQLN